MSIARGPWRTPPASRPSRASSALTASSSASGSSCGLDEQARVQEARLVEHLADRVGVVGARAREHPHARAGQRVDGAPAGSRAGHRLRRRPDVRAEARAGPCERVGRAALGAHARVVESPAAWTFSPIACANGSSPEIGRSITVKSAISPCSSRRSRSRPSISRPSIAGPEDQRVQPAGRLELVGVAEVLERVRDDLEQPPDGLAPEERVEGRGAVEDDVLGEQRAGGLDVAALDGGPEGAGGVHGREPTRRLRATPRRRPPRR